MTREHAFFASDANFDPGRYILFARRSLEPKVAGIFHADQWKGRCNSLKLEKYVLAEADESAVIDIDSGDARL